MSWAAWPICKLTAWTLSLVRHSLHRTVLFNKRRTLTGEHTPKLVCGSRRCRSSFSCSAARDFVFKVWSAKTLILYRIREKLMLALTGKSDNGTLWVDIWTHSTPFYKPHGWNSLRSSEPRDALMFYFQSIVALTTNQKRVFSAAGGCWACKTVLQKRYAS